MIELSYWRPLTLSNVEYRILAKVIAKRIERVLPALISFDQTGFVKDKFIGQNLRLLNDIMEYAEAKIFPVSFSSLTFERLSTRLSRPLYIKLLSFLILVQISENG